MVLLPETYVVREIARRRPQQRVLGWIQAQDLRPVRTTPLIFIRRNTCSPRVPSADSLWVLNLAGFESATLFRIRANRQFGRLPRAFAIRMCQ